MFNDHPRALVIAYRVEFSDHANTADGYRKWDIGLRDRQRATRPPSEVAAHECALERLVECDPRMSCLAPMPRAERAMDALASDERLRGCYRFDAVNVPVMMLPRATPKCR